MAFSISICIIFQFVIRFQKNLFNQGYSSSQENANYLNVQNDIFTLNTNTNTNNSNNNINSPNNNNNNNNNNNIYNTNTGSNNFIYDLTNEAELLENSAKKNDKYTVRRILDAHYSQFQMKSIEQINTNRCIINTNTSKINEEFKNYRLKSFRLSKYFNTTTPSTSTANHSSNNNSDPYQQSLYNQLNFINNKAINNFHNSLNTTTARCRCCHCCCCKIYISRFIKFQFTRE